MRTISKLAIVLALSMSAMSVKAVVISQIYGGGGNVGALYTHDFVELFNDDPDDAFNLAGLSLQYASATGTGNFGSTSQFLLVLPNVTLAPGQYFLAQGAQGGGGTIPLPTPDAIWGAPLAAGAGKVALVDGVASLGCNGGSTPCSDAQLALIIDLVGYGGADFFEGAGAAPTLTNTTAAFRNDGGCADTDNNFADFSTGAPVPRNTASPLNVCSTPGTVPEPASLALLGLGLAGLAAARRCKQ